MKYNKSRKSRLTGLDWTELDNGGAGMEIAYIL